MNLLCCSSNRQPWKTIGMYFCRYRLFQQWKNLLNSVQTWWRSYGQTTVPSMFHAQCVFLCLLQCNVLPIDLHCKIADDWLNIDILWIGVIGWWGTDLWPEPPRPVRCVCCPERLWFPPSPGCCPACTHHRTQTWQLQFNTTTWRQTHRRTSQSKTTLLTPGKHNHTPPTLNSGQV